MGRIRKLTIDGYKSIGEKIEINFPQNKPVVLFGENNVGKSNILSALDMVLGDRWTGNHELDDHESYGRNGKDSKVHIEASVTGVRNPRDYNVPVSSIAWNNPAKSDSHLTMVSNNKLSYANNDCRFQCFCFLLGADRRLRYQLSYTNRFTLLSRLMSSLHKTLVSDSARVERLKELFEQIRLEFGDVQEFAQFSSTLSDKVQEFTRSWEYGLDIDFSAYDPSNYFHSLRVNPLEQGETRNFDELGSGQEQLLALAFAYTYATVFKQSNGLILALEEPEANLHPAAQKWMAKSIRDIAHDGNIQIILTTHSPAFLDLLDLDGFVRVYKEDGCTYVEQMTAYEFAEHCKNHHAARVTSGDATLQYYAPHATEEILNGLFARKVVLVEGPSEAMALPVYLSRVGLDLNASGISLINAQGVTNIAKWWRLLAAYRIPCYVLFDNDKGKRDRKTDGQEDILRTLGVNDSHFYQFLEDDAWIVNSHFSVFAGDFEETMTHVFGSAYQELEHKARSEMDMGGKAAKPLRARYIADRLDDDSFNAARDLFAQLAEHITALDADSSFEYESSSSKPLRAIPFD